MKIQRTGTKDRPRLFVFLPVEIVRRLQLEKGMELDYHIDTYLEGELAGLRYVTVHRHIEKWD